MKLTRNFCAILMLLIPSLSAANPKVNWPALWAAHEDALRSYRSSTHYSGASSKGDDYLRTLDAAAIFERAGIDSALGAAAEGISPQKAAAIMNDYGFFLAKIWEQQDKRLRKASRAEPFLRQAIEIDPNRAVAYLNLADHLRDKLGNEYDWAKKERDTKYIYDLYKIYLNLGGAPSNSINSFMLGDIGADHPGDICRVISEYTNIGRLNELISFRPRGVSIGDKKYDLTFSERGTAHAPYIDGLDSNASKLIRVPNYLDGNDYLGLLVYRDTSHIIHFKDMQHPISTRDLKGNLSCRFKVTAKEKIGSHVIEPELCEKLNNGTYPPQFSFDNPVAMTRQESQSRFREVGPTGMHSIDILNDGKSVNVVELVMNSGAGAGCDATFYDTTDEAGRRYTSEPARELLWALQGADPRDNYPVRPCGNDPRFFVYKGKTYFETKPKVWPPDSEINKYHRVTRVENNQVVDVCNFQFLTEASETKEELQPSTQKRQSP